MAGDLNFTLRLNADGSAFVGTIQNAREEVEKLGKGASDAAGGGNALNTSMTSSVALGSLLSDTIKQVASKLVDFTGQAIAAGDRLSDMAAGTGRSISELQTLEVIALKGGGTLDGMVGILDRVARSMDKGGEDTGRFKNALDFFGISLTDSSGKAKSAETVAYDLAIAYRDSEKSASVAAAMQVLLGQGYEKAIPQLLGLIDKEKEVASLRKFGAIVSDDLAAASNRLSDTNVDVHSVMTALGNALAESVVPTLQALADWFIESATNGGVLEGAVKVLGLAFDVGVGVFNAFLSMLISLDTLVQIAGRSVGALAAVIANPGSFGTIWSEFKADVVDINTKANAALEDLWNGIDKVVKKSDDLNDRGPFSSKNKKAVEDYSDEIKNLANRLDGITNNEAKNYIRAQRDIAADQVAGKISTEEQTKAYLALAKRLDDAEAAHKKTAKATRDSKSDTVDLTGEIDKLKTELGNTANAMLGVETNTKNYDKAYSKLIDLQRSGKVITDNQKESYLNTARALDDAKVKLELYNKEVKAAKDYADAEQKAIDAAKDAITKKYDATAALIGKAEESNEKIREETVALGLNIPEQIAYAGWLEQERIMKADLDPLQRQRLLDLNAEHTALLLNKSAVQDNITAYKNFMAALEGGIKSFIDDWINGGWSNAWKNAWNKVLNWGLEVFSQWASKQIALSFTVGAGGGIPGLPGGGAAGSTGGGGGGGIFDSILGAGSKLIGGFGDLAFAAADFTQLLGQGVGIVDAFGMAASGAGLTLGSLVPVVGGVVAAGTMIYNWIKGKEGGPKEGGFATTGATPGIGGTDSSGIRWFTPNGSDAQMLEAVQSLDATFNSVLAAFGGSGSAVFAQGFSTDPKGTAPSNVHTGVWVGGSQVGNFENGNVGRSPEELQAELAEQGMRAVLAALQASALPAVVADYLASIDVSTATIEQIQAGLAHAAELYEPVKALTEQVKALPADMIEGLVQAIGVSPELDASIQEWADKATEWQAAQAKFNEAAAAFWEASGKVQDALDRDPKAEALNAFAAAHVTTFEKVGLAKDALIDLTTKYDGSTDMTNQLADATNAYRDAQVEAMVQIYAMRDALLGPEGLFSQTQHTLDWALMSKTEQTNWLINEAKATVDLLKTTTDPAQIEKFSQLINKDLTQAFNLMSPEEQKAQHDYLMGILNDAAGIVDTQLDAAEEIINDSTIAAGTTLGGVQTVLDAAGQKWNDAAQLFTDTGIDLKAAAADLKTAASDIKAASAPIATAATTMAGAATTMETAANTPVAVTVQYDPALSGP